MLSSWVLLGWLLIDALASYGVLHHRRIVAQPSAPAGPQPRAAVVIAIKGINALTGVFLEALRAQQYASFRLIFAVESEHDPAVLLLRRAQTEWAATHEVDIIVAGESSQRAQKVHNLLAALATLRVEDRIVVLADADIVPMVHWLRQLIEPIASGMTTASGGYRWQLPTAGNLPELVLAAADMSVATTARSARWNLCWGGSVALERSALEQLQLPRVWDRAASDDLTLTAALRAHGLRLYAPPRVLVASPVSHDWSSMLSFVRRQYLLLRMYAPRHWLLVAGSLWIPVVGAAIAAVLLWHGRWWPSGLAFASGALLQYRLYIRLHIATLVLSERDLDTARSTIAFARLAWPLIHLIHAAAFASSAIGRDFSWAGIRYRMRGGKVEVIGRR